jgi:hypothetical protein
MEANESNYRWNTWLDYVREREVVPILGSELVTVEDEGQTVSLDLWIARRLAQKYNLAPVPNEPRSLNTAVSTILLQHIETEAIVYADVRDIVRDGVLQPSESLRKLASITDFDLFVTTTFDPLMEMALNEIRFKGAAKTVVIKNSLRKVDDLPDDYSAGVTTLVHLMGHMSNPPYFAVTDNDELEFLCRLQNKATRPERLFAYLKEKHLLVLGGRFPDWAGRLVLRTMRNDNLHKRAYPTMETLVDKLSAGDQSLAWFVGHFSKSTTIYPQGGSAAFIDELHRRWTEDRERRFPEQAPSPQRKQITPGNRVVFISYTRPDYEAARTMKLELERRGFDAWMDDAELQGGDDYTRKISNWVNNCAVFVPVISRHTEMRPVSWFRREWTAAIDRLPSMHEDVKFIFPVSVDNTRASAAIGVPDKFKRYHWTYCEGGMPPPDFLSNAFTDSRF